jgi:hypothetical protein
MFFCQEKRLDTTPASAVGWVLVRRPFASCLRRLANSDILSRGPASFRCKAELGVCGLRERPRRLVKLTSGVLFCALFCAWRLGGPLPLWERALDKRRQEQAFEKPRRSPVQRPGRRWRTGRPIGYFPTELGPEPPQKPVEAPPLKRRGAASTHQRDYIAAHALPDLPPLRSVDGASPRQRRGADGSLGGGARGSGGAALSVDSAAPAELGRHQRVGPPCTLLDVEPGGEDAPRATRRARAGAGGAHEGRASGVRARRDRRRCDFDVDRVGEVRALTFGGAL